MGSITTGVGLISGIDTASLIDSLIALEGRSKTTLQRRVATLQSQQTALLDINARLLSLKTTARSFRLDKIFQSAMGTSSNESIITASASAEAQPGTFNFIVKQLVSNSQKLSRGFADYSTSPVGLESLTFALGRGNLDRDRDLAELNAGQGVRAGKITITDRSGEQATVDLSDATTVNEVLQRINNTDGISVTASVQNDAFVITDTSGGAGSLTVSNSGNSFTATDLGIAGSVAADELTGSNVNLIGAETSLASLNDGTGVLIRNSNPDLRITDRNGTLHNIDFGQINANIDGDTLLADLNNGEGVTLSSDNDNPDIKFVARDGTEYEVNLSGVTTVNGLINRVNSETDGHIQLSIGDNNNFIITDTIGGSGQLQILGAGDNEDATANDLGIFTEGVDADVFEGEIVPNTIQKPPATTLGEIVDRINEQTEGAVTASIDQASGGLVIIDQTGGTGNLIIRGTTTNQFAAAQLGIETGDVGVAAASFSGGRLIASLGSVLSRNLNGGAGLGGGTLDITDRSGASMSIGGLDSFHSLDQIIREINSQAEAQNVAVHVSLNDAGTGLLVTDSSGGGGNLTIAGTAAAGLGVASDAASDTVRGSSLQTKYVSEATKLADLNYGRGIGSGSFRITDGFGKTATINVGSSQKSLYDIIQVINAQGGNGGIAVRARLNDTGDGLLLEEDLEHADGATPYVPMKVEALTGSTAKDLNILGTSSSITEASIDGGYTRSIDVAATDTLEDIITKINESGVPISATVLNTGSGGNPYRINFTSSVTGRNGEMIIDSGGFNLGLSTLSRGQDAKVLVGGGEGSGSDGFLVTSPTNTLSNVIPNVSIDLHAASSDTVSVTISRDERKIIAAVEKFVEAFNSTISRIDEYDFYDVDKEQRGILLGNATAARIRASLINTVRQSAEGVDSEFQFLRQVGIRNGAGATLEFDQERFLEAWQSNPDAVENLFASYESKPKPDEEIMLGVTIPSSGDEVTVRGLGIVTPGMISSSGLGLDS